mmetsp:Transcript_34047/g.78578  ORF Transcript_34047/g.78578 Transcript_34047/m.78578 type:complete len:206 (-) Transcript_34047:739-1356(-)
MRTSPGSSSPDPALPGPRSSPALPGLAAAVARKVTQSISTRSTHSSLYSTGTKPYVTQCASGHSFRPETRRGTVVVFMSSRIFLGDAEHITPSRTMYTSMGEGEKGCARRVRHYSVYIIYVAARCKSYTVPHRCSRRVPRLSDRRRPSAGRRTTTRRSPGGPGKSPRSPRTTGGTAARAPGTPRRRTAPSSTRPSRPSLAPPSSG